MTSQKKFWVRIIIIYYVVPVFASSRPDFRPYPPHTRIEPYAYLPK